MSIRPAATLAVLTVAALAVASPALASRAVRRSGPAPLAPATAARLVTGPQTGGITAARIVPGSVALAAARLPGSATWVGPGLSLSQAVGLAPLSGTTGVGVTRWPRVVCWAVAAWHQWGTWPYQQRLTDATYWCALYGRHITFRSSSVTTNGMLCGTNWRSKQLIGGGIGFSAITLRSGAGYACPTVIPWITLHPSHHIDVWRNDRGRARILRTG